VASRERSWGRGFKSPLRHFLGGFSPRLGVAAPRVAKTGTPGGFEYPVTRRMFRSHPRHTTNEHSFGGGLRSPESNRTREGRSPTTVFGFLRLPFYSLLDSARPGLPRVPTPGWCKKLVRPSLRGSATPRGPRGLPSPADRDETERERLAGIPIGCRCAGEDGGGAFEVPIRSGGRTRSCTGSKAEPPTHPLRRDSLHSSGSDVGDSAPKLGNHAGRIVLLG
jgi:hypothetical protein